MSWLGALKRRPRVSEKQNFKKVAVHLLKFDFIWQTAPKYFAYVILTITLQLRKRSLFLLTCNKVSSSVSCDIQDNLEHLIKCFTFLNIAARNSTWKCNNMLITNFTHCLLSGI